jgi:hypothetical protein
MVLRAAVLVLLCLALPSFAQTVVTVPVTTVPVTDDSAPRSPQEAPKASGALNGNWHLSGSFGSPVDGPRLIVSLIVEGDKVMGGGDLQMVCEADHAGIGSNFFLLGQIAADGTFTVTDLETSGEGEGKKPHLISISGKSPGPGEERWSGKYALRIFGKGKCTDEITGNFVARRMPALKGTYSGTLVFQDRSTAMVRVDIEQGELTRLQSRSVIGGRVSLNGKMTVRFPGSPAQAPVTLVADHSSSYLNGGEFCATFSADGVPKLRVFGSVPDATGQALSVMIYDLPPPDSSALNSIGVRLVGGGRLTRE